VFICGFILFTLITGCSAQPASKEPKEPHRIPVILDTDAGNDNDDNFALVCLLSNPKFDVKLITTTDGQQEFRGRIIAKLLTAAGRNDIPIGFGAGAKTGAGKESSWVADFPFYKFAGKIHHDGVRAMIDTIHHVNEPVTLIAIGPLQTVAAVLERDPAIAGRVNFVGMQGSVFKGYGGSATPTPEFNVKVDVAAAQTVFSAKWASMSITPLDTCGLPAIAIDGERFEALRQSNDPLVKALLDSFAAWSGKPLSELHATTTQFDSVAVYLADPDHPLLVTKPLHIDVNDAGMTVISPEGRQMNVATSWKDVEAYRQYFFQQILGK
jgi:inosine-uridine nucleoside N-ribohydrolase